MGALTLGVVVTAVVQESTLVADAGQKSETGAMVGAFLPDYIAENLTVPDGEPANELHITFAYLGKANELTPEQASAAHGVVQALATAATAPSAVVSRISHFGPNGAGQMAVVYEVDSDDLQALRAALVAALEEAGVPYSTKFPVYRPHVTIGYWPADEIPDEFAEGPLDEPIDVSPEALSTAVAGERHSYPFAEEPETAELAADPNPNTPHQRDAASAGYPHGPSIKWSSMYEGLRRHGFTKSQSAAISNAAFNKYRRFGRPGAPGQKSAAAHQAFLKARRAERRAAVAAVQPMEFRDLSEEPRDAHGRWVRKLLSDVEPGGGKSVSLQTGEEPLEGYAVSRPGSLSIAEERAFEDGHLSEHALRHIDTFVGTHPELYNEAGTVLGVFHDTDNRTVDVDVTDIVPKERKDDAIALGLKRNQKVIYSLHDEKLVPTGGKGEVAVAAAGHDVSAEARDAKGEFTKGSTHHIKELEETHGEWDHKPNNGGRDEDASSNTDLVRSFRGRPVPVRGDTVDIYRDLSKEGLGKSGFPDHTAFSMIRAKGGSNSRDTLVAGHTRGIHIHNVRSSWNVSGKRTAELHNARGVHAFTRGQVHRYVDPAEAQAEVDAPGSGWQKVTYYPGSQFFFRATDRKHFHSADEAYLINGELYVKGGKFTDDTAPVGKIESAVMERMRKPVAASAVLDGFDVWESGETVLQLVQFSAHDVTDEARDTHGRWTTGTGGRISAPVPTTVEKKKTYNYGEGHKLGGHLIGAKHAENLRDRIARVPGFEDIGALEPMEAMNATTERMARNIEEVFDRSMEDFGKDISLKHAEWYPLAHELGQKWAEEFGMHPDAVFALLASLSPGADWADNVAWAHYILQKVQENPVITEADVKGYIAGREMKFAADSKAYQRFLDGKCDPKLSPTSTCRATPPTPIDEDPDIPIGKHLNDLTLLQAGRALRGMHEANNKEVRQRAEFWGKEGNVARPGRDDALGKAWSILQDPSTGNISKCLGQEAKVRSFYNNIRDPLDSEFQDITADTHHFGVAFGLPWTQSTVFMKSNDKSVASSPSTGDTGVTGAYPLIADATRIACERVNKKYGLHLQPNQVQSVVWEWHRTAWDKKSRSRKDTLDAVNAARTADARGEISHEEALKRIEAAREVAPGNVHREFLRALKEGGAEVKTHRGGEKLAGTRKVSGTAVAASAKKIGGRMPTVIPGTEDDPETWRIVPDDPDED